MFTMLNEKVLVDIKILEQVLRIGIKQFTLSTYSNSLYNKIENVEAWKAWNSWNEFHIFEQACLNGVIFSMRAITQGGYSPGGYSPGGYSPDGECPIGFDEHLKTK